MKNEQSEYVPILGPWQKKQAAMLYYYASADYLKPLHTMVTNLINNVADPMLDLAKIQGRDAQLISKRWGTRHTSQNWSNNAWPFLKELQTSLATDLEFLNRGEYRPTSVDNALRGIDEYSTDWATKEEEKRFKNALARISAYALPRDRTVIQYQNSWDDFLFFASYPEFSKSRQEIPKSHLRFDLSASTGELPPTTGVYIAHGDRHATLQFASNGKEGIRLRTANTFNDIGLAALAEVGRDDLWRDEPKMFNFAMHEEYSAPFRHWILMGGQPYPASAPATVSSSAFKSTSCKWSFVEIVPGEMEHLDTLDLPVRTHDSRAERVPGGMPCGASGFYFTPSLQNSRRHFNTGDIVPDLKYAYGNTFWQWDDNQLAKG